MNRLGYGLLPYLVYRHYDTHHPHLHLVSVAVNRHGEKIPDQFINFRCNQHRQALELQHGLVQAEGRDLAASQKEIGQENLRTANNQRRQH